MIFREALRRIYSSSILFSFDSYFSFFDNPRSAFQSTTKYDTSYFIRVLVVVNSFLFFSFVTTFARGRAHDGRDEESDTEYGE